MRIHTMAAFAISAFSAAALAACETSDFGGTGEAWAVGPGYVSIDGNKRFGVSYLPDQQAAMLTFTLVGAFSADGEEPEPPVPDEWRAAAVAAAPEGCTVDAIEQVDVESYRATYACGE